MKILLCDDLVKYAFADTVEITLEPYRIVTSELIINDLNSGNTVLLEGIADLPEDFTGNLYRYAEGAWARDTAS